MNDRHRARRRNAHVRKVACAPPSCTGDGERVLHWRIAAALLATYLWTVISIDVGAGSNRFDRASGELLVTRQGFRQLIKVEVAMKDIQAVKVEVRDGLSPRRRLALRLQGRRDLPLTRVGEPMPLDQLEQGGAELARFLGVPLEGV